MSQVYSLLLTADIVLADIQWTIAGRDTKDSDPFGIMHNSATLTMQSNHNANVKDNQI